MKRRYFLAVLIALALILPLSACGSRNASAAALITDFYNIAEANKSDLTVLTTESTQGGYYAAALYTGSGSHLVLFRIEKDAEGKEKITGTSEGGAATAWDCSVNIVEDSGKTVVFGNVKPEAQQKKYTKISITFEDGSKAERSLEGGAAFILAVDGTQKVKDFTLSAQGQQSAGALKNLMDAGGGVMRTAFNAAK